MSDQIIDDALASAVEDIARRSRIWADVARGLEEARRRNGDSFAPIRFYAKTYLGIDRFRLTDHLPALCDALQVELGLAQDDVENLTPRATGALLALLHVRKSVRTEEERQELLRHIEKERQSLSSRPNLGETGRILLKALRAFPEPANNLTNRGEPKTAPQSPCQPDKPQRRRLKPGEAADLITAALDALIEKGELGLPDRKIIRFSGVSRSTFYRLYREGGDVAKAIDRYHRTGRGKGPVRLGQL